MSQATLGGSTDERAVRGGAKGYRLLHPTKTEPWGQTITRLLGPEGLLVGVAYTPWRYKTESA